MKISILNLGAALAVSLTAGTARADWACTDGQIYFNIHLRPNSQDGVAEITHFVTAGGRWRGIPLPERLWGPVEVHLSQEGTHFRVEGEGFLALLKMSAGGAGFTAFLRAPTGAGGISLDPASPYFCR